MKIWHKSQNFVTFRFGETKNTFRRIPVQPHTHVNNTLCLPSCLWLCISIQTRALSPLNKHTMEIKSISKHGHTRSQLHTQTNTHKELPRHHQFTHCQYRINKQQKPQIEKGNFVWSTFSRHFLLNVLVRLSGRSAIYLCAHKFFMYICMWCGKWNGITVATAQLRLIHIA